MHKKFSVAIVQVKVVIHCNATDRKSRLNYKSMAVVNAKCVIVLSAMMQRKICQQGIQKSITTIRHVKVFICKSA